MLGDGDGLAVCAGTTEMVTVEPGVSTVPGEGLVCHTVPGLKSSPLGGFCFTGFTWKPSFSSCEVASAWDSPTTPGTLVPPPETKMVTVLPLASFVFGAGFCRTTVPCGCVELGAVFGTTMNPSPSRVLVAVSEFSPVTSGTETNAAPVDTNRSTLLFLAPFVPNGGLVLITSPLATVLEALLTAFGSRPAATTAFWAA